jgi:hypothetical protein
MVGSDRSVDLGDVEEAHHDTVRQAIDTDRFLRPGA